MNPKHWLVVVGTVNEGFSFYGPFDDSKDANRWAQQYFSEWGYQLSEVMHPNELK